MVASGKVCSTYTLLEYRIAHHRNFQLRTIKNDRARVMPGNISDLYDLFITLRVYRQVGAVNQRDVHARHIINFDSK